MNDVIIRAERLTKTFKLYSKPHYRFLDMLGLLRRDGTYQEHCAIREVDLLIRKGEKVAFIGRNGAGKSTLLRLITGVTQPSSGTLVVTQGAHALLQIGTGFHPDFTGRENALAYLAHLGVSGEDAERKVLDIIDFAELEEYIDQPVKTYSSGMMARLMFATSTAIEPELLILDEILGVGDAYFSNKSYERIREMCAGGRTTVLLVSHDIYSAQKLSDRMIWIDQGRILLDDVPEVVVRGYEDSIRVQEEARLRKKVLLSLQRQQNATDESLPVYLELRTSDGRPLAAPVWFSRLALSDGSNALAVLGWGETAMHAEAINEGSSWGNEDVAFGQPGRWMSAHGVFHKVAARFDVARRSLTEALREGRLVLEVHARTEHEATLFGEIEMEGRCYRLEPLVVAPQISDAIRLRIASDSGSTVNSGRVNTTGQQGSGAVLLESVRLLDRHDKETFWVRHGDPAAFLLEYRIVSPGLSECCDICLVFFRAGTRDNICRIFTRDLKLDASQPKGTIRLDLDRVVLGAGKYSVWVFIAKNGYLTSQQHLFYSINPDVYLSQPDILEFEVSGDLVATNTAFVGDGHWSQA